MILEAIRGIQITTIDPANLTDPRGHTYELWKGLPCLQVTYAERCKGIVSGNHFHTGIDPSKKPERVFILSGQGIFAACNGTETMVKRIGGPGLALTIDPWVVHAFYSLSPLAFLEHRMTVYDRSNNDTYAAGEFLPRLQKERLEHTPLAIKDFHSEVRNLERHFVLV